MTLSGQAQVAGLILAGGRSTRMGSPDKALVLLQGRPLLDHVLDRVRPQVGRLALSANGDPVRFAAYGLDVLPDQPPLQRGPLAGILSGLEWTHRVFPEARWMASFAVDCPLLPDDLVRRLIDAVTAEGADIAIAQSGKRLHPVIALWPVASAPALRLALDDDQVRSVQSWTDRLRTVTVVWDSHPVDPFFNINTPDDLRRLAQNPGDR